MGVQETVLGLVVERPDYGYGIWQRLDDAWSLAAIYKALKSLRERGLIEPIEVQQANARPQKHYQPTERGISLDATRFARAIRDVPDHHDILRRLETASLEGVRAIIDEYERLILAQIRAVPNISQGGPIAELMATHTELLSEARLRWIAIAREAFDDG